MKIQTRYVPKSQQFDVEEESPNYYLCKAGGVLQCFNKKQFEPVPEPPKTYKQGQHVWLAEDRRYSEYVIAQVSPGRFALIGLHSGNRYAEGIPVKNTFAITEAEMKTMLAGMGTIYHSS